MHNETTMMAVYIYIDDFFNNDLLETKRPEKKEEEKKTQKRTHKQTQRTLLFPSVVPSSFRVVRFLQCCFFFWLVVCRVKNGSCTIFGQSLSLQKFFHSLCKIIMKKTNKNNNQKIQKNNGESMCTRRIRQTENNARNVWQTAPFWLNYLQKLRQISNIYRRVKCAVQKW